LAGLTDADFDHQHDRTKWPALRAKVAAAFKSKTREQWCAIMEGSDVCFAPVLTMTEAKTHPHLVARGTFIESNGVAQPGPAPRFSATPSAIQAGGARAYTAQEI